MRNLAIYLAVGAGAFIVGLVLDAQTPVRAASPAIRAVGATHLHSTSAAPGDFALLPARHGERFAVAALPAEPGISSDTRSDFNRRACSLYETFNAQLCDSRPAIGSEALPEATGSGNLPSAWTFHRWLGSDISIASAGDAPVIESFTASADNVKPGSAVTLGWETTDESIVSIDKVGGVRGASIVVHPKATTRYVLTAVNRFGRTIRRLTVTVR